MTHDWTMPREVFSFLRRRLPPMAAVLELGSGTGTAILVEMFGRVHTVEHDPEFVGKVAGAHYIHAPIHECPPLSHGWYDAEVLRAELPYRYDCLIVDGPPGALGRAGILKHLSLFAPVPVVVDDVHRRPDFEVAAGIAQARDEHLSVHHLTSGRAFATIGWGEYL